MRRALAAVAAIAMVVAAVVARRGLDDRAESGKDPIRLTCAPELASVCSAVADRSDEKFVVTVEAPATTVDRLTRLADDAAPPLDAWLVTQPWPAVVDGRRTRAGRDPILTVPDRSVARTPLVVVARRERATALRSSCPDGELTWTCIGEKAGQPWTSAGGEAGWNRVKVGHGDPAQDATSILVIGQAVARWFQDADPAVPAAQLSTADLETDDAFAVWFARLERSVRSAPSSLESPLQLMLSQGVSAYDVVAATEAESATVLQSRPSAATELDVVYPQPVSTADAKVVTVRSSKVRDRAAKSLAGDAFVEDLAKAGWRTDPSRRPVGSTAVAPPSLPSSNGLPNDGLLEHLLTLAKETS